MINFKITGLSEAQQFMKAAPKKVTKAAKDALTRTKDSSLTQSAKLLSGRYNITQKDLLNKGSGKPRIQASGRVGDDLTATISYRAGGISLVYFGATEMRFKGGQLVKLNRKGQQNAKRGRPGVTVQIERGKTTRLKQFMAAVKYGKGGAAGIHLGIFRRAGQSRYPIVQSLVISPASMIQKPVILKPLQEFVQKTFTERFNHEMKRQGVIK